MAGIVYTKLLDALKGIGVDVSQKQASNVKKLSPKNKSTATKPGLLASERDTGGNFATVLDIFKNEAKYIDSMNDAEQMAFLNNILDYNEFGGKSIGTSKGIEATEEMKKFKNTQSELKKALDDLNTDKTDIQTSLDELMKTAKTMKDEAEVGKKKALQDLDDFFETGGQPLKKKDDKFLGGSMHEEGQLRTGIRQFLQTELDKGRLKLNAKDTHRVRNYYPTIEDDVILVFKRVYGDEAYKKAGTFPGAFEIGENFKHYEEIFRENMGEELLKVKNKDHVGDGTLVLDESLEYKEPLPDDPDIPFAKGGRASFAGGKVVDEILKIILKKEPIEAMKEVNKVIGKKGKYKNLTQKDIDRIVDQSNDWIFQRDPDNLYVYDDGKTIYDDDLTKEQLIEKESRAMDKADEMSFEDSIKEMEGLGATKTAERYRLKNKYPGITDGLLDDLINDPDPNNKARALAALDEAMTLQKAGKSEAEIIEILKSTPKKEMATGGRAGFDKGGSVIKLLDGTTVQIPSGAYGKYGLKDWIYSSSKGDLLREDIIPLLVPAGASYATGGRAGFYMGGQSTIKPDLSDIGHGSDSLMARTRLTAPGSQATTSTGLNYLLGEDNDNTRIPFNDGLLVPKSKPYTTDQFDKDSMLLLKGVYGTGPESNTMFYNSIIDKGNKLRKQGVDRETVIEIIRKNKDKIKAFLETQTTSPKSFEGLESFEMKADGGRIGYATKGKVSLSDLESLKGLKKAGDNTPSGRRPMMGQAAAQRNRIKNKVISSFIYAVDNMDQEKSTYVKDLFNTDLVSVQVGYETDTSGIKTALWEKSGIVPINSETIYNTIVNLDLPKEITAEMSAIVNKAGEKELSASLKKNNMGITWDDQSQEIKGEYTFTLGKDGNTQIQPIVTKDQDSQISKEVKIDQAVGDGTLNFTLNESDIDNASGSSINYQNDSVTLFADKKSDDWSNTANFGGTVDIPLYLLNKEEKPYISAEINKNLDTGFESKMFSGSFPITDNLKLWADRYEDDQGDWNNTNYGLGYYNTGNIGEMGNWFVDAGIDKDKDWSANVGLSIPFGEREKRAFNYSTNNPKEAFNMYKDTDGFKYEPNVNNERMPPRIFAEGGIAGLRPGYAGGSLVDKGRRGFLKFLGGTAAGVIALKTGLAKILGKESGAVSKKVIDEVIIDGGTGAPAWLQPLVNKALRDGTDKTKSLAYKDAQTVKSLDTPTGKVDVYYDVRTGEVDIDYIGGNTALGENVHMRYTPGVADESTKGVKPADEFEATESIPEGNRYGPDDFEIEMGENTTGNVKDLYSDTTELAELGGQKPLIKDIAETIKKKKVLKQMEEDSAQFVTDVQGDYVPD